MLSQSCPRGEEAVVSLQEGGRGEAGRARPRQRYMGCVSGLPKDADVWGRLADRPELVLEVGMDRQRRGEFRGPGVFEEQLG